MSDPTYVEGWSTSNPLERIRRVRCRVGILTTLSSYSGKQDYVLDSDLLEEVKNKMTNEYGFTPSMDVLKEILEHCIKCSEISPNELNMSELSTTTHAPLQI